MSEFFRSKEKQVSIFGKWQIQQPFLRVGKQRNEEQSKPEQVRRAEEVLNDAQLLYSNVTSFLSQKRDLFQRIQEHKGKVNILLQEAYQLNNSKNKNLEDQDNIVRRIRQILQQLYRVVRQGQSIEDYIVNYFQNANLANYDPRIHQLRNTKSPVEAQQQLQARMQQILQSCNNLYRSLHYIDKLETVFSKEEGFNYCLINLQELISHDSLVKVHALMIRSLIEVQEQKSQLVATNRSVQSQYLKYQLVYDCLQLMKIEREEMVSEMELFQRDFKRVTNYVPTEGRGLLDHNDLMLQETANRQTMQKIIQSEALTETNLKVYRANIQNFTRASAQTSLYCYSYRLSFFDAKLTEFERYFAIWKVNLTTLRFFYQKRNSLLSYRDQQNVKKAFFESSRHFLQQLYEQVRDRKIGQNKNLEQYQQNILTDIQRELKQNNIPFTPRVIQQQQVKAMLQKQNEFFQTLAKQPITSKVYFIRKNKNTINEHIFSLQQLIAHGQINNAASEAAIDEYAAALAYCQIIAASISYEDQLYAFQNIQKEGKSYQGMPSGMTEFALSYIHDLNIILKSQSEKQAFTFHYLQEFGEKIQAEIRDKRKPNIEEAVDSNIFIFSQFWLNVYARFYRFVTPVGEELILDQLLEIGLLVGRRIRKALQTVKEMPEINANRMQIQSSQFMTYKVLLALQQMITDRRNASQVQKFKISNINSNLQALFNYIDQKFITKQVKTQPNDLIKITLVQYILSKIYKDNDYSRIIRTLRLQMFLQIISKIYSEYSEHELVNNSWLHPLMKIQLRMLQISYNGSDNRTKTISERLNLLLPQIRKLPLAIGGNQDFSRCVQALQITYYITHLQKILESGNFGISEAAVANVGLRAIYQSFILVEMHFQAYENAVVNQKKNLSIFFEQLKQATLRQTSRISERNVLLSHFNKKNVTLKTGLTKLFGLPSD